MGFFNEISNLFESDELDTSFKIEVYGGRAIVVVGYEKIKSLSESEIDLMVKNKNVLQILGAKLCVKKLEEGEIVISGEILSIALKERG